jgi:hypothetical protein
MSDMGKWKFDAAKSEAVNGIWSWESQLPHLVNVNNRIALRATVALMGHVFVAHGYIDSQQVFVQDFECLCRAKCEVEAAVMASFRLREMATR